MANGKKIVWMILLSVCVLGLMVSPAFAVTTEAYTSYDASPTPSTFLHTHPSDGLDSAIGQAMNFSTGGFLHSVIVYLWKAWGSPNGVFVAEAYEGTGTFGTDFLPSGSAVAVSTNTLNVSSVSAIGLTAYTFYFDATYAVNVGDELCIVIVLYNATVVDVDNRAAIGWNDGVPAVNTDGNGIKYNSNTWNEDEFDVCMKVSVVDTYGDSSEGSTWSPSDPTDNLVDSFANFIVPLAILLVPSILFIIFFGRTDKWLILIGLAIGAGLGYYFGIIPVWLVFLVAIGLIGLAYSEVRRNG